MVKKIRSIRRRLKRKESSDLPAYDKRMAEYLARPETAVPFRNITG